MVITPRLISVIALALLAALLVYGSILTFTQPSTTVYFLIFPIATVGPSFVAYLAALVMLVAGLGLGYLSYRVAV